MLEVLADYFDLDETDELYRAASYVLSQNLVHGDALTMPTYDGRPITFAEWGYLGKSWKIVQEYVDQGVSGSKESRPALNRLMADACRRRFDAVVVWKIDRFGRSLKHLVNSLAELAALG